MNYTLKISFLTISLFCVSTFSSPPESTSIAFSIFEEGDDTTHALDKALFPKDLTESIKNKEFCSNDFFGILNKLGLWDLCSKPLLEEMFHQVTEHHTHIDESQELAKFSTDDLEKYASLCKERLDKVYKDHLSLLEDKKAYNSHITTMTPIILLMYGTIQFNKMRKTILTSIILITLAFIAHNTLSTTNKDMAYTLLENLYEITHSFLIQEIQNRQKHTPNLASKIH